MVEARAGGRVAGGRPTPAPAATHHPPITDLPQIARLRDGGRQRVPGAVVLLGLGRGRVGRRDGVDRPVP